MRPIHSVQSQTGVALVLSLLLLLVLTIVGVAAMNSTIMQERMAGNIQTQTRSIETSAEGVGRALEFFHEHFEEVSDLAGHHTGAACGFIHSALDDPPSDSLMAWSYPADGFIERQIEGATESLWLGQRMYCCRSWVEAELEDGTVWVENPSNLFVLNRGAFLTQDGEMELATREIEVRLDEADPGEPTCAFCIPGDVDSFEAPNSNSFGMHGGCGPAITTESDAGAGLISEAISGDRISNYTGGIVGGDMGEPWNDANKLAEFVWWIKLGLHEGDTDNTEDGGYFAGDHAFTGNDAFGVEEEPVITYFDGDVRMGGNISGHGIMIVAGELEWAGTPEYQGLIVTLGGAYTAGGGGMGGAQDPGGSIVTTNLVINNTELSNDTAGDTKQALGSQGIPLPYQVAVDSDEDEVLMYDPNDVTLYDFDDNEVDNVPSRPVLIAVSEVTGSAHQVAYFNDGGTSRFFDMDDGNEMVAGMDGQDFRICKPGVHAMCNPGEPPGAERWRITYLDYDSLAGIVDLVPRDKFGRLIPNFVVDVANVTWPHETIQYDPNRWGWGFCEDDGFAPNCDPDEDEEDTVTAPPFRFGGSNFDWSGGGGQGFVYDCRRLQEVRHRLLCEEKHPDHDPELDVDDEFYEEGDHSSVCNHSEAGFPYNENLDYPVSGITNQHAWHLWGPKCDCLGLVSDADMIISGWRENLGWRDDDFVACQNLPGPD